MWAIDFQWDQTADGHNLNLLHVVDEFTREALAIECLRRINSDQTVNVLDRLVAEGGTAPGFIRCDNWPEMTVNAPRGLVPLLEGRERLHRARLTVAEPHVESFGGRVRDELLSVELFSCLAEAQVLIEDWRVDYNEHRAHRALGMMTPVAFAASLRQPLLEPTATAAGEGVERRWLQTNAGSDQQPSSSQPGEQQNPAQEITHAAWQANSQSSYRGATTTPTQLSQRVDQ